MGTLTVTVLGCGGSGGVPGLAAGWGRCDPREPRNRRRRPAILLSYGPRRILVDTPPELREQLLDAGLERLDAVIFTHSHADHLHGIDDLRPFNIRRQADLPIYTDERTLADIRQRFGYVLESLPAGVPFYHPVLTPHVVAPGETHEVAGLPMTFLAQDHGFMPTLGLRVGPFGYSTDVVALPEASLAALEGLCTWILDCQRPAPAHSTHAHLATARDWIARVGPREAYLTHMNHETDYAELAAQCPRGVAPAYDGLSLAVDWPDGPTLPDSDELA